MKQRLVRAFTALPIAGLLVTFQPSAPAITAHALDYAHMNQIQKRILSGFASTEMTEADASSSKPTNYFPRGSGQCPTNLSSNIKVNQNCLNLSDPDLQGRAQAQNETSTAINPIDTNEIIASSNDYRRGDGNCYASYSDDNGRTWQDSTVPMSFTRGRPTFGASRQYWQAGGDTSVAWDTKGNAYLDCQVFERGHPPTSSRDLSSAVYVFRSTQNHGASWNFPGRPVIETADLTGSGVPAFEDKPYMTVDNHVGSPYQDRVYVAYTEFTSTGSAYIWESYSSDYGETFSARKLVSITSPLCTVTFGAGTEQGSCNENQFADPFTGSDGSLYIAFNNYNNSLATASDNRNQILVAKSTDGGNTFTVTKATDYYDLPDCATYQAGHDFGRACVPEKGASTNSYFRATNYPSGAVDPTNPARVVVNVGSYINSFSNEANGCVPAGVSPTTGNDLYTGVKTPGACNNKILQAVSTDGGATFNGTAADPRSMPTVNVPGQAGTDQFWQWTAFTKNGKQAVDYYDRQYGTDETTGFSDVSLSGSGDLANFVALRVTSSSNPPPTQFGGNFLGDYNALDANTDAHPVWMDTRDPDLFVCPGSGAPANQTGPPPAICTGDAGNASVANDQDLFTANLPVPSK